MKKFAVAVAMMSAIGVAQAESGTVTITGEIVNEACGLSPDSVDKTVDLGKVPVSAFNGAGSRSEPVPFDLLLTQCDTMVSDAVNVTFTGAQAPGNPDLLATIGTAKGVGVRLQAPNGDNVALGNPTADVRLTNGDNILRFTAAYEAVDAVTAGTADSVAQFDLIYN